MTTDDDTTRTAIAITEANCKLVIGMSWVWVRRFARKHDVPIWHVSRKPLIPSHALLAAIEAASNARAAENPAPTKAARDAERRRAFERELAASRLSTKR